MGGKSGGYFSAFNSALYKGPSSFRATIEPGSGSGAVGMPECGRVRSEPTTAYGCEAALDNSDLLRERRGRTCDACDKPMSAYNNGSMCYVCEDKAQADYHAELDRKVEAILVKRAAQERAQTELIASGGVEVFA